MKKHFLTSLFM